MMKIKMFQTLFIASLLIFSCTEKPDNSYSDEHKVITSPVSLECESKGGELTFEVTTDAAWQAYAADDCNSWVSKVSPNYSKEPKGKVSIVVAENLGLSERRGNIVIKCGTTRHKVELVQKGNVPEQSDITCPLEGYRLVWHDEFDGEDISSSNWRFENWPWYYVNNELQYYVAGGSLGNQQTAFIDKGVLNIKAQKANGSAKFGNEDITGKVISARMNSRKSWKYCYMEARLLLPKGKGSWPAFWCMPDDQSKGWPACGEIDIMEEVGAVPNEVSSSIHTTTYNHTKGTQKTAARMLPGAEGSFHVYAMEWTADYIKTYVDGKLLFTFNNDKKNNNDTWPFNKNFYLTLNLAWGGMWGGMNGVDESALPCTFQVDYVRVFQK